MANGLLEFDGAAMGAAANLPLGEGGKPALDLIEPGSRSGREVNVKARVPRKPDVCD